MNYEDAVLDLSNPKTISWYQDKIARLIKQGVSVIKCDFGEAAPYDGLYASGKTGFYEHNLYPLRYNQALWEAVKSNSEEQEGVIWTRSAWQEVRDTLCIGVVMLPLTKWEVLVC